VLRLLPDRRRLLDGTGLDLYRDFDALLIATPNPFDDAVTFLAVRHRLDDDALRAAFDRGAEAGGRAIEWRQEGGRWVGTRKVVEQGASGRDARDDRLLVLPAPGLAVIAPPAYAKLLLERPATPDGGAPAGAAAGTPRWAELVARIDAEDGALPKDAVFSMTAANLLHAPGDGLGRVVPGTRGTVDDDTPARAHEPAMPGVISMVAGTTPTPFLEIGAEFAAEQQARIWEGEWPGWKQKLLGNPLVLLAGLNPLVSRAEVERADRSIVLRTTATSEETRRLLQMVVNFARGGALPR